MVFGAGYVPGCTDLLLFFFFCQIFPRREFNFTSDAICSWVFEHRETVLQWLQPPGTKSRLLERELTKGPALLLFLPHNPLGSEPDPVLQQVSKGGKKTTPTKTFILELDLIQKTKCVWIPVTMGSEWKVPDGQVSLSGCEWVNDDMKGTTLVESS